MFTLFKQMLSVLNTHLPSTVEGLGLIQDHFCVCECVCDVHRPLLKYSIYIKR